MPTKVKVKKSSTRVMGRACTSSEFVNLATSQGFDKRIAENAWRAMVEQVRGSAYHRDLALPENLSYGQIRDLHANGRPKKGRWGYAMADTWQLIDKVAPALLAKL